MTRTMYDSVNLHAIPRPLPDHSLVAYYLDGPYAVATVAEVEAMFPTARLVPIDVNNSRADYARALDVENGDATPADCEGWLTRFKASNPGYHGGARGLIYCNRSNIAAVREGTGPYRLGIDYTMWVATGDGTLISNVDEVPNSVTACQNLWRATYDTSEVFASGFLPN